MDDTVFDRLARRVSGVSSRRAAVRLLAAAVGSGVAGFGVARDAGAYPSDCERFVLSGGKNAGKEIDVDDDLTVFVNGKAVFRDNDGVIGIGLEAIEPIRFRAEVGDTLRIVAKDGQGPCHSLSPLWLHCRDGGQPRRLTQGVDEVCDGKVRTFFDKKFRI
jgi:hypothetical protein